MVPPRYVEELKNQRVDEVDFVGTFFEVSLPAGSFESYKRLITRRCLRAGTPHLVVGQACIRVLQRSS